MTDYNDGKIHGWNGGQCPVHPKSRVSVISGTWNNVANFHEKFAGDLVWDCIFAFRVIKPYTEPREMWAVGKHLFDSPEDAKAFLVRLDINNPGKGYGSQPITKWREVTE